MNYTIKTEEQRQNHIFYIRSLQLDERKYKGKIDEILPVRSLNYNAYYWGVILPIISNETGHNINELHGIYKGMFLVKYRHAFGLEVVDTEHEASTKILDTKEFDEYVNKIRVFANVDQGIVIPDINDMIDES